MAKVTITPLVALGNLDYAGVLYTETAGDAVDGAQVVASGKDLVIAKNTGAGAQTVTITSVADSFNRTRDVAAVSLAAGAARVFGPYSKSGWMQADRKIYMEGSSVDVVFTVIQVP